MKIRHILDAKPIQNVETIGAEDLVSDAASKLSQLRIGSLLVSDDGNAIEGILSERDIVRDLGVSGASCMDKTVSEIMTAKVKTVTSDTEARMAVKIMSEGRFRHLPVVDDGKLIGMISIGDVVSARLKEIEVENMALNDMITGAAF